MPCFHPLPAYRTSSGGVRIGYIKDESERLREMQVPCGSCLGCLKAHARSWAIRCQLELNCHALACWCTLTYDDKYVPPTLSRSHFSAFFKRMRADEDIPRFRFFGCGEYGERTFRPHYHAILFGLPEDIPIQKFWRFGFAQTHTLSSAAISYVAGYCAKKLGFKPLPGERIDYETGEVYEFVPPFLQMSRGGRSADGSKTFGIGGAARACWRSWKETAIDASGREVPVPRYLHSAWKARASAEEIVALQLKKEEQAYLRRDERTPARIASAEAIALAQHKLSSERRFL